MRTQPTAEVPTTNNEVKRELIKFNPQAQTLRIDDQYWIEFIASGHNCIDRDLTLSTETL